MRSLMLLARSRLGNRTLLQLAVRETEAVVLEEENDRAEVG